MVPRLLHCDNITVSSPVVRDKMFRFKDADINVSQPKHNSDILVIILSTLNPGSNEPWCSYSKVTKEKRTVRCSWQKHPEHPDYSWQLCQVLYLYSEWIPPFQKIQPFVLRVCVCVCWWWWSTLINMPLQNFKYYSVVVRLSVIKCISHPCILFCLSLSKSRGSWSLSQLP